MTLAYYGTELNAAVKVLNLSPKIFRNTWHYVEGGG